MRSPEYLLSQQEKKENTTRKILSQFTCSQTKFLLILRELQMSDAQHQKIYFRLLVDYWTYREEISAENGLLFKGHRLIISKKLHSGVLQTIHKGHFGFEKMQLRAQEAVFWPGITSDLLQTAQSCKKIILTKKKHTANVFLLLSAPSLILVGIYAWCKEVWRLNQTFE